MRVSLCRAMNWRKSFPVNDAVLALKTYPTRSKTAATAPPTGRNLLELAMRTEAHARLFAAIAQASSDQRRHAGISAVRKWGPGSYGFENGDLLGYGISRVKAIGADRKGAVWTARDWRRHTSLCQAKTAVETHRRRK